MGLIYAGLISPPPFSPFRHRKMHTGEEKKKKKINVSDVSNKVVNVGGAANIQL